MRKNQFLACMVAAATVFSSAVALIPVQTANAQGLTQAANAELVKYGALDNSEVELMKTLFDFEYYKSQNPDLVEILGNDYDMLFKHFCKCGIFEGRTCNPNFDPAAYASAYGDLKDLYGTDIVKYYQHYAAFGSKENRTLTTVKACAEAGISVQTLSSAPVVITPQVFKLSEQLGITDYTAVQAAVNAVVAFAEKHSADIPENTVTHISVEMAYSKTEVRPERATATAYADAKTVVSAAEATGTIAVDEGKFNKYIDFAIIKGSTGYAIVSASPNHSDGSYNYGQFENDMLNSTPVYSTVGYEPSTEISFSSVVAKYELSLSIPWTGTASGSEGSPAIDYKDDPLYQCTYWASTEDRDDGDNWIRVQKQDGNVYNLSSTESVSCETTEEGTNMRGWSEELKGYYTNSEGTEVHVFADDAEKQEWQDAREYPAMDGYEEDYGLDNKGQPDTTYTYGFDIQQDNEGKITGVSIGVYNDDTQFGYVYEDSYTYTPISGLSY